MLELNKIVRRGSYANKGRCSKTSRDANG